jgi:hypothetical protein
MSRKKISTTIYVTPEQNEQLKLLHARTKVPIAVFIREGIDLILSRYARHLPGQLELAPPASDGESPISLPTPPSPVRERASSVVSPLPVRERGRG